MSGPPDESQYGPVAGPRCAANGARPPLQRRSPTRRRIELLYGGDTEIVLGHWGTLDLGAILSQRSPGNSSVYNHGADRVFRCQRHAVSTIASNSVKRGFQPSQSSALAQSATSIGGSPGRRAAARV